jgi:hypothetical protein
VIRKPAGQSDAAAEIDSRWDVVRLAVVLAFAAVVVCAAVLFADNAFRSQFPWVNHDVAFLTHAGFEILNGARLYIDFQEVNPPGSQFLHTGLMAVAVALGVSEFLVTHWFVLSLGVAGFFLLREAFSDSRDSLTFILVTMGYLLLVVRGNFSNNVIPSAPYLPYDFGQREQIFALLFFPYVMWRISRRDARGWEYAYLVALGFVGVFKPYWILLIAIVEAYAFFERRGRNGAVRGSIGLGMILPYLILLLHSPFAFRAFFGEVVPQILSGAYSHYGMDRTEFLLSALHLQMVGGFALVAVCWLGCYVGRCVERRTLAVIGVVLAVSYLSLLHQQKYWSYHGMVLFGAVAVTGAFLRARLFQRLKSKRLQFGAVAVAILALAGLVGSSLKNLHVMLDRNPPKGYHLVPLLRGHQKVMFFSMAVDFSYAPLFLRMKTVGPWRGHYLVPVLLEIEDPERRREALDEYAQKVLARIEAARPDLLLFAPYVQGLPPGVRLHDVLLRHGAIPAAGYSPVRQESLTAIHPALSGWVVYERQPGR